MATESVSVFSRTTRGGPPFVGAQLRKAGQENDSHAKHGSRDGASASDRRGQRRATNGGAEREQASSGAESKHGEAASGAPLPSALTRPRRPRRSTGGQHDRKKPPLTRARPFALPQPLAKGLPGRGARKVMTFSARRKLPAHRGVERAAGRPCIIVTVRETQAGDTRRALRALCWLEACAVYIQTKL